MSRIWCWLGSFLLFVSCSEGLSYGPQPNPEAREQVSIAYLKTLAAERLQPIRQSLYIEGEITANDHFGEFPEALFVQDPTAAIELRINASNLYLEYPLGRRLRIFCDGLYIGSEHGKLLLGEAPKEGLWITGIAAADLPRRLHPLADPTQLVAPLELSIPMLDRLQLGLLVTLRDLHIAEADGERCWCDRDPLSGEALTTYHHLQDEAGGELLLYAPASCSYADEPLPVGRGSFCGILDYREDAFCLRPMGRGFFME